MYFTKRENISLGKLWVWIHFRDQQIEGGSFDDLLRLWLSYYEAETPFTFVFDTNGLHKIPNPYLCIRMALFIRELKKQQFQYLCASHIVISQNILLKMLDVIFAIQGPVAPVHIYLTDAEETWSPLLDPSSVILP